MAACAEVCVHTVNILHDMLGFGLIPGCLELAVQSHAAAAAINSLAATGAVITGPALSGCWLIINVHYSVHFVADTGKVTGGKRNG